MNRKPIFEAVRAMLGRGFTQSEVDALDAACNQAEGAIAATTAPLRPSKPPTAGGRTLGKKGLDLIKSFEGCESDLPDGTFEAYPDPGSDDGDPWTIGWGSTGNGIREGTIWTKQQCDAQFEKDMERYAATVSKAIGNAPTTQNQFDALVSFHYNTGAIAKATLTKRHINKEYKAAEAEFARWNKNAGKVMKGLVRRRAAEAALYATP